MNKFAGLVIDPYDDVDGAVISSMLDASHIPEFVKSAERVDPERATTLPDDNFALVLLDRGMKMRKYATVDKGNTALSVMYLLKQAHYLPENAVKIAAHNLIEACERFHLDVPFQLKLASTTGTSGMSGQQNPYIKNMLNKNNNRSSENAKESETNPDLGKGDASQDARKRTNLESVGGSNFLSVPPFGKERNSNSSSEIEKCAEHLELDEIFSSGGPGHDVETRKRNWRTSPYVDVADWEPGADLMQKKASVSHTLLKGRYPVDTYEQIKTAAAYLHVNERTFHPRDRREYCIKLAARMDELGMKVDSEIRKHAASGYGDAVSSYVNFRKQYVDEALHPALEVLLEKQAQVKPETFASALETFDKMAYLDRFWGSEIPDPWTSTYGQTMAKIAEEDWRWDHNGTRVCEGDLDNLATNGHELVRKAFGEKFATEFGKSPKSFFEALPTPNKLVLGRLAMDRYSGTGTE